MNQPTTQPHSVFDRRRAGFRMFLGTLTRPPPDILWRGGTFDGAAPLSRAGNPFQNAERILPRNGPGAGGSRVSLWAMLALERYNGVLRYRKWIKGWLMPYPVKEKRKGNYKAGPGRPPGRKNNRTLELEEATRQAAASIDNAFEGDAHAFLQAVYKNPEVPLEIRIQAAGRALRVEKPTLSAGRTDLNIGVGLADRLEKANARVTAAREVCLLPR